MISGIITSLNKEQIIQELTLLKVGFIHSQQDFTGFL